jgi:iron complex outermembrane recepter protein
MTYGKTNRDFLYSTVAWALLAGFSPAFAQAPAAGAQPASPTTCPDGSTPANGVCPTSTSSEIIVTGSRLPANEFTSPSPVQILSPAAATQSGVHDTASLLQGSTLAAGSPQLNATISSAFVTSGGPGSASVSLRGLGPNRTLVLLNGRRAGPAGTRGQVSSFDLNVIPQGILERVDILKDGASSVYGSDAVAGTVNLITRQDLDGGSLNIFGSIPAEGAKDGSQFDFDGAWGKVWDRGYFNVSVDYFHQNRLAFGDRKYTACGADYDFHPDGTRADRLNPITGRYNCFTPAQASVFLYEYVDDDGSPFDYNLGPSATDHGYLDSSWVNGTGGRVRYQYDFGGRIAAALPQTVQPSNAGHPEWPHAPAGWIVDDFDYTTQGVFQADSPLNRNADLIPDIERDTVFMQAGFDLTSNVQSYAEVLLNRRNSSARGVRQVWTYLYSYDYSGRPGDEGWTGAAYFSPTAITDHFSSSQRVDYMRGIGGVRGHFGNPLGLGEINWDVFVQYSRSKGDYTQDVILQDAVDTANIFAGTGFGSCVGTVTPVSNRPCVDVRWLSPDFLYGHPSAAEAAFLFDTETGHTTYTERFVEGFVSGDILKLPAGNVGAVLGFHVQHDSIDDVPGAVTLANNSWGLTGAQITRGRDSNTDYFAELSIPVLRGIPLAEDVRLSLSGRSTDVDTAGTASTYKIGLNWQLTSEWRVRATKGTSFRAPALFENFLSNETSFLGQRSVDPCIQVDQALAAGSISQTVHDNCLAGGPGLPAVSATFGGGLASTTISASGGLGHLKPEDSKSSTVGIIWTPSFVDLNIAVDYYDIDVQDEVRQLGGNNIPTACYSSLNFPADPLCTLFTRPSATSGISTVINDFINVADQTNRGIDFTTQYRHQFPAGDLTWTTQVTWQLENTTALFEGFINPQKGTTGNPPIVGNSVFEFDVSDWDIFWRVDYFGRTSDAIFQSDTGSTVLNGFADDPNRFALSYKIREEPTIYHTVSVKHDFGGWELTGGVANIFDEHPPALTTRRLNVQYSTVGESSLESQYDYIGRRFFFNIARDF